MPDRIGGEDGGRKRSRRGRSARILMIVKRGALRMIQMKKRLVRTREIIGKSVRSMIACRLEDEK